MKSTNKSITNQGKSSQQNKNDFLAFVKKMFNSLAAKNTGGKETLKNKENWHENNKSPASKKTSRVNDERKKSVLVKNLKTSNSIGALPRTEPQKSDEQKNAKKNSSLAFKELKNDKVIIDNRGLGGNGNGKIVNVDINLGNLGTESLTDLVGEPLQKDLVVNPRQAAGARALYNDDNKIEKSKEILDINDSKINEVFANLENNNNLKNNTQNNEHSGSPSTSNAASSKEQKRANEKRSFGKKRVAKNNKKITKINREKFVEIKQIKRVIDIEKLRHFFGQSFLSLNYFLNNKFGINLFDNLVKEFKSQEKLKKGSPLKTIVPSKLKVVGNQSLVADGVRGISGQDVGARWLSTQEEFQVGYRNAHAPQEEIQKEEKKIKLWQNILYIARMKQSELPKGLALTLPWEYRERALQLEGQKKVIDTFMLRQIDVGLLFVKANASKHALEEFISQKVPTLSAYAKGLFEQQWLPTDQKTPSWMKWADKEGYLSSLDKPRQNVLIANALEQGAQNLLKEHMERLQIKAIDSDSLEQIVATIAERKENGLSDGLDEKVVELLEQCMGGESLLMDHIESLPPGALRSLLLHLLRSLKDRQNNELVIEALKKKIRNKKVQQSFEQALVVGSCVLDKPTILDKALKDSTIAINDVFDEVYLRMDQLQNGKIAAAQQKYVKIKQSLTLMTIAQLSGASGAQKLLSSMGAEHLSVQDLQKLKEQIILSTNATLLTKQEEVKSTTGNAKHGV